MAAGSMSVVENLSPESPTHENSASQDTLAGASEDELRNALSKKEQQSFQSAAQSLRQALQDMPELAELSKQLLIDQTPEGLRIQLVDQDGRSMFKEGSAQPNDRARLLLRAVARVVNQLPNRITISGHTSATQGVKSEGDWALSAQRADVARQILQGAGIDNDRVYQVAGKANSDPLYPDDPTLAGNRRIALVLLHEKPVLPPDEGL